MCKEDVRLAKNQAPITATTSSSGIDPVSFAPADPQRMVILAGHRGLYADPIDICQIGVVVDGDFVPLITLTGGTMNGHADLDHQGAAVTYELFSVSAGPDNPNDANVLMFRLNKDLEEV